MCKLGVISQERLKIKVKLLLIANRKSVAQQRMTLSNLERPFHASRAISAVAELLVLISYAQRSFYFSLLVSLNFSFFDAVRSIKAGYLSDFTARSNAERCISYSIFVRPSVRLSVCPSHAGIASNRAIS